MNGMVSPEVYCHYMMGNRRFEHRNFGISMDRIFRAVGAVEVRHIPVIPKKPFVFCTCMGCRGTCDSAVLEAIQRTPI